MSNILNALYIQDLDKTINEPSVTKLFKDQDLQVTLCRIFRNNMPFKTNSAVVHFATHEEAERALTLLNYSQLNNNKIRLSWYNPDPNTREQTVANVYVKNLDPNITSKELQNKFSFYGNVVSCKVS